VGMGEKVKIQREKELRVFFTSMQTILDRGVQHAGVDR